MANSDELRRQIDQGQSGDKVPFPDPAAAPLGTDDEAGGHPPSQQRIALARQSEISAIAIRPPNVTDESTRSPSGEGLGLPPRGVTPLIFALLALFLLAGGLGFAYFAP